MMRLSLLVKGRETSEVIMYEDPVQSLSDEQIEEAIDSALHRGDRHFVGELVDEAQRRGLEVEI